MTLKGRQTLFKAILNHQNNYTLINLGYIKKIELHLTTLKLTGAE